MDFEKWKDRRLYNEERMVSFRGMKGWQDESDQNFFIYFPEDLISFVEHTFSHAEIDDLYYTLNESNDQTSRLETLKLRLTIEDYYVDCSLYLEMEEEDICFEYNAMVDHSLEVTEDTKKFLSIIYHRMKQFIEENSPQRLALLSSDVDEWVPEWMTKG